MILSVRVVRGITDHFALRYQEWIYSAILLVLAVQLLRPGETFQSSPAYAVMAQWADERTWGVALIFVGGFRFLALVVNGTFAQLRRISPYVRSAGAAASSVIWFMLSLTFYQANPLGFGEILCLGLTCSDLFICIKTARDAGEALEDYARGCARF